jgi:hypothetical protein
VVVAVEVAAATTAAVAADAAVATNSLLSYKNQRPSALSSSAFFISSAEFATIKDSSITYRR